MNNERVKLKENGKFNPFKFKSDLTVKDNINYVIDRKDEMLLLLGDWFEKLIFLNTLYTQHSIYNKNDKDEFKFSEYKRLILNLLNEEQKIAYNEIETFLDPKNLDICIALNAPAGTGKTFLIGVLLSLIQRKMLYIAYSNNLVNMLKPFHMECEDAYEKHTFTVTKFLIKLLRYNYFKVKTLFNVSSMKSYISKLQTCLDAALDSPIKYHVVIIDEYTVLSPRLLIYFYCLCACKNIKLIFVGHNLQQNTIQSCNQYSSSNFTLISTFSKKILKLIKNTRITDKQYLQKINTLTSYITCRDGDTPLTYPVEYLLFELFPTKYFSNVGYHLPYCASYHRQLNERLEQTVERLKATGKSYTQSYYTDECGNILNCDSKYKYANYILLVPNWKYIYSDINGKFGLDEKRIVTLLEIKAENVTVKDEIENVTFQLTQQRLAPYQLVDGHYNDLMLNGGKYVVNFPLKNFHTTYYSIQGLTIKEKLELNVDAKSLNAIYVGLSRIDSEDKLSALISQHKFHFLMTWYKNDEYYYKIIINKEEIKNGMLKLISTLPDRASRIEILDKLIFTTVSKIKFKSEFGNIKTLKCNFAISQSPPKSKLAMDYFIDDLVSCDKSLSTIRKLFSKYYELYK